MTYASTLTVATFWTYKNSWLLHSLYAIHRAYCFPPYLFLAMVPLLLAAMVELPYI